MKLHNTPVSHHFNMHSESHDALLHLFSTYRQPVILHQVKHRIVQISIHMDTHVYIYWTYAYTDRYIKILCIYCKLAVCVLNLHHVYGAERSGKRWFLSTYMDKNGDVWNFCRCHVTLTADLIILLTLKAW